MSKANQYIRAVIEIEFDAGDTVDTKTVFESIQELYWNNQLHIQYFDAHHDEYSLNALTDENN